jgi:Fic family protein
MNCRYSNAEAQKLLYSSSIVKCYIVEGLTIGGKKLQEHLEVINHAEAIDFVEECVNLNQSFNENVLKKIHYLIFKNIDNKNAGNYRQINVRISGSKHN